MNSPFVTILGGILGLLLVLGGGGLVYFVEDKAINTEGALKQAGGEAVSVSAERVDPANEGKLVHLTGKTVPAGKVADPETGIAAEGLALSRVVEVFQWKEEKAETKGSKKEPKSTTYTYTQIWSKNKPPNSSSFNEKKVPPNPSDKRFADKKFVSDKEVKVGAFTLSKGQVERLEPNEDLPITEEMLATVSEDIKGQARAAKDGQLFVGAGTPEAPAIGDVRIHYKVAKPVPVTIMAKQSKGSFEPYAPEGREKTDLIQTGEHSAESMLAKAQAANQMVRWLMLAGGVLLIGLGVFLVLRWRIHAASEAAPEGVGANVALGVLALLAGVSLALIGFGSRWLTQDPVIGGGMMGGGAAALGLVLGGARLFKPSLFSGAIKWSDEEKKAFRKVALDPENPDLRLELAAMLEKKGNPMGEFIRVSHELEALPEKDERREELDTRAYTLLEQQGRTWFQPLRRFRLVPEVMGIFYPAGWMHQGIIDEVVLDLPGILPERAEEFFAAVPGLRILQMNAVHVEQGVGGWKDTLFEPDVPAIANLPQMKQIGVLRMSSMRLKTEDLEAIASSPNLVNLVELDFGYNTVGPQGAVALAESPTLKKLRVLELRGCEIGEEGAVALAKSANLARLTTLNVGANAIGKAGMKVLVSSSNLKQIQVLTVDDNQLGPVGGQYVAVSPFFRQLTSLDLGRNDIGSETMTALAKSPNLARVTILKLNENKLHGVGVRTLAGSPHLGKIKVLDLSSNEVDDDGARGLAACEVIHDLEELILAYNKIGDAGLTALAGWTGLAGIKKLALRDNKFGPVGIKALVGSPHLKGIKELDLSNNEVGLAGAKVLANATTLKDLEHLWLGDVKLNSDAEEVLRDRFGDVLHL